MSEDRMAVEIRDAFDSRYVASPGLEDRVVSTLLQPGWNRLEANGDDGFLSSGYYAGFRSHNQITWGLRAGRLSFWLSEDFTPGSNSRSSIPFYYESNSPDVTIGVRWLQPL